MNFIEKENVAAPFDKGELSSLLESLFQKLGPRKRILVIPPDITRIHSMAGEITEKIWNHYGESVVDIIPALGTHDPLTREEIGKMFGAGCSERFLPNCFAPTTGKRIL
jgi:nickel-dependent lactate racemase